MEVVPFISPGVDVGTAMTKAVVTDETRILASVSYHTGAEHRKMANKVMEEALYKAVLTFDDISYVVATGELTFRLRTGC